MFRGSNKEANDYFAQALDPFAPEPPSVACSSRATNPIVGASRAVVLVAHSSPLVAAGLTSVLRRLEGCEIRLWDAMSETSVRGAGVVVVDDLAMAAQFSTCAGFAGEPNRVPAPKVVLLTNSAKEVDRAFIGCVSAWLSIDCPEEELLGAVRGLLHNALPARWSLPIRGDGGVRGERNSSGVAQPMRPTGGLAPRALKKVREHIDAHLARKIDQSRLAGIAGLSTSYFSRAFKQTIGMPPHRYVLMRRLGAAAELIRKTSKPLAEVAIEVGFSDQSHFTRTFTRLTGETPGALSRRYR